MSSTIQTLCADALGRAGLTPADATREAIDRLAKSLDARARGLDDLDRAQLEALAVAYAFDCATAEMLETACGEQGPLTASGRPNPALAQAASVRTRMHRHLKAIKSLIKTAPRTDREGERTREAETTVDTPHRTAPKIRIEGNAPAEASSGALAKEEPQRAVPHSIHPDEKASHTDTPASEDQLGAAPASSAVASTEPPSAPLQPAAQGAAPTAPPMNRAQRRAQERLENRIARKQRKRLRNGKKKSAAQALG